MPLFQDPSAPAGDTLRSVGWVYPRLRVEGTWHRHGEGRTEPVAGCAWFERAWTSVHPLNLSDPHAWMHVLFADRSELVVWTTPWAYASNVSGLAIDPQGVGRLILAEEFRWAPRSDWKSAATGCRYPVAWSLSSPALGIECTIQADFPNQEVAGRSLLSARLWLGSGQVQGIKAGRPVAGEAYIGVNGTPPAIKRWIVKCAEVGVSGFQQLVSRLPPALSR